MVDNFEGNRRIYPKLVNEECGRKFQYRISNFYSLKVRQFLRFLIVINLRDISQAVSLIRLQSLEPSRFDS